MNAHKVHVARLTPKILSITLIAFLLAGLLTVLIPVGTGISADSNSFTIVVLPDTQYYARNNDTTRFEGQMNWVVANKSALNIVFVAGLGDIVDDATLSSQWAVATNAYQILANNNIQYSVGVGNHDTMLTASPWTIFPLDGSDPYDVHFPYTEFTGDSWYGGHYPSNSDYSNYELFSACGNDYVILNVECQPTQLDSGTIAWCNQVLTTYSNRTAIVITHGYIDYTGKVNDDANTDGIEVWNDIVQLHSNVIMVCCGHNWDLTSNVYSGEYRNIQIGTNGNVVEQLLTDYQGTPNNGNGWLRYYTFNVSANTVNAYTYSPTLNQYATDPKSQFSFGIPSKGISSDATLSNLTISSGILTPTFAAGATTYTDSVANSVTSITVTPTANQGQATINVNGTPVASGQVSGAISLNVGVNTINVVVTAQDGITTDAYTVTVTRVSSDATLSKLTISSGTLMPTFASGTTSYTDSVANSITSITVTPTAHQGQATINVNGTPVASGQVSGAISLNVGVNTINVVVTAQDGITTDTYTMTVTRAASNNANFGYNGAGTYSSSGFYANNFLFCEPGYTGVTSTGVSMSFLTSNSDTINAHNVRCAIYTLSAGTFSLVAQTNAISVPAGAAKGWVTGNFTTSPNLSSSTTYYLAVQADSSSLKFYVDSQPGWKQYVYGSKSGIWPSTFVSPTLNWNAEMPILVNCMK